MKLQSQFRLIVFDYRNIMTISDTPCLFMLGISDVQAKCDHVLHLCDSVIVCAKLRYGLIQMN